jgi:transmembrane sensor
VDDLIFQVLGDTASPFEVGRLKQWREAAPENEEYFQEMAQVWSLTAPEPFAPASGPPPVEDILVAVPIPSSPDIEPVAAELEASPDRSLDISERRTPQAESGSPWLRWGLMAASVAAVGLGLQFFGPGTQSPTAVHQAAQEQSLTVTLGDGSFVRLAAGSSLREWDVEGTREVSLEGKAFFAVARDEARPFIVRAGAGEVRVLGTRFQVSSVGDEMETVVVEGLVRVTSEGGSVEVPAGSMVTANGDEAPETREVEDVLALLDWPEGTLLYQATPLSQVVQEVSRYYGRDLIVADPDISQRRVTAWFQGEPFEVVSESLCLVTEAVCRTSGETVTMGSGGSGG